MTRDGVKSDLAKWNLIGVIQFNWTLDVVSKVSKLFGA